MNVYTDDNTGFPMLNSDDHLIDVPAQSPLLLCGIEISWAWTLLPRVLLPACAIAVGTATPLDLIADDRALLGWRLPDAFEPPPLAQFRELTVPTRRGRSFDPIIKSIHKTIVGAGMDPAIIENIDVQMLLRLDEYDQLCKERREHMVMLACS